MYGLNSPPEVGPIDKNGIVVASLGHDANPVLRSENRCLYPRVIAVEGQLLDPCAVVVGESAAELQYSKL